MINDEAALLESQTYTINDVVRTLNISRTTLVYYEQQGVIRPRRESSNGYRRYTQEDIFRLMSAVLLKNVGIMPKDLHAFLDTNPLSNENFAQYVECAEQRLKYDAAVLECLTKLDRLRTSVGKIEIADIEAYYVVRDGAEQGYHNFSRDEGLDLLIESLPIGGLGLTTTGGLFSNNIEIHWCRTIALRHASLIDGFVGSDVVGGRRCVCCTSFQQELRSNSAIDRDVHRRMQAFLDNNKLEAAGEAFVPYSLPSEQGFFFLLCLPVVACP